MTFAAKLKSLRHTAKLSQTQLEAKTGIKREYISKMETDDLKNPTIDTVKKLARGLGVDPAIFLTDLPEAIAAIISATCEARREAETAKQFREFCGQVAKMMEQLEEMGRGK